MQGAVGPVDRLFEASRNEMSDSDITGVKKVYGSNGLKRRARSMASIAASGWLRIAWIIPLDLAPNHGGRHPARQQDRARPGPLSLPNFGNRPQRFST